jgi:hypothetical protein
MNHLEARRPRAHLAVAAHAPAARERLLDAAIEVKPAQRERTRAVREAAEQRASAPVDDVAELDDTLDERLVADGQTADGPQRRAVFVALRQKTEQVPDRPHAELREPFGDLRADARETVDGLIEER